MKLLPLNKRNFYCAVCGAPHAKYLVTDEEEFPVCNICVLKEFERRKEFMNRENKEHVS